MQNYSISLWLHIAKSTRVTEEVPVAETAVWPIPFLINMFTALKGSQFYLYLLPTFVEIYVGRESIIRYNIKLFELVK